MRVEPSLVEMNCDAFLKRLINVFGAFIIRISFSRAYGCFLQLITENSPFQFCLFISTFTARAVLNKLKFVEIRAHDAFESAPRHSMNYGVERWNASDVAVTFFSYE